MKAKKLAKDSYSYNGGNRYLWNLNFNDATTFTKKVPLDRDQLFFEFQDSASKNARLKISYSYSMTYNRYRVRIKAALFSQFVADNLSIIVCNLNAKMPGGGLFWNKLLTEMKKNHPDGVKIALDVTILASSPLPEDGSVIDPRRISFSPRKSNDVGSSALNNWAESRSNFRERLEAASSSRMEPSSNMDTQSSSSITCDYNITEDSDSVYDPRPGGSRRSPETKGNGYDDYDRKYSEPRVETPRNLLSNMARDQELNLNDSTSSTSQTGPSLVIARKRLRDMLQDDDYSRRRLSSAYPDAHAPTRSQTDYQTADASSHFDETLHLGNTFSTSSPYMEPVKSEERIRKIGSYMSSRDRSVDRVERLTHNTSRADGKSDYRQSPPAGSRRSYNSAMGYENRDGTRNSADDYRGGRLRYEYRSRRLRDYYNSKDYSDRRRSSSEYVTDYEYEFGAYRPVGPDYMRVHPYPVYTTYSRSYYEDYDYYDYYYYPSYDSYDYYDNAYPTYYLVDYPLRPVPRRGRSQSPRRVMYKDAETSVHDYAESFGDYDDTRDRRHSIGSRAYSPSASTTSRQNRGTRIERSEATVHSGKSRLSEIRPHPDTSGVRFRSDNTKKPDGVSTITFRTIESESDEGSDRNHYRRNLRNSKTISQGKTYDPQAKSSDSPSKYQSTDTANNSHREYGPETYVKDFELPRSPSRNKPRSRTTSSSLAPTEASNGSPGNSTVNVDDRRSSNNASVHERPSSLHPGSSQKSKFSPLSTSKSRSTGSTQLMFDHDSSDTYLMDENHYTMESNQYYMDQHTTGDDRAYEDFPTASGTQTYGDRYPTKNSQVYEDQYAEGDTQTYHNHYAEWDSQSYHNHYAEGDSQAYDQYPTADSQAYDQYPTMDSQTYDQYPTVDSQAHEDQSAIKDAQTYEDKSASKRDQGGEVRDTSRDVHTDGDPPVAVNDSVSHQLDKSTDRASSRADHHHSFSKRGYVKDFLDSDDKSSQGERQDQSVPREKGRRSETNRLSHADDNIRCSDDSIDFQAKDLPTGMVDRVEALLCSNERASTSQGGHKDKDTFTPRSSRSSSRRARKSSSSYKSSRSSHRDDSTSGRHREIEPQTNVGSSNHGSDKLHPRDANTPSSDELTAALHGLDSIKSSHTHGNKTVNPSGKENDVYVSNCKEADTSSYHSILKEALYYSKLSSKISESTSKYDSSLGRQINNDPHYRNGNFERGSYTPFSRKKYIKGLSTHIPAKHSVSPDARQSLTFGKLKPLYRKVRPVTSSASSTTASLSELSDASYSSCRTPHK